MEEASLILITIGLAAGLALVGEVLRLLVPGLRKVFLPGAVLGGVVGLLIGPQVNSLVADVGYVRDVFSGLAELPGLFINVVFACLMLGRRIEPFSKIWFRARPQIVMGHIYAWGQYVIGLSLVLLLLAPLVATDTLAGLTIAIGFQGGHGTAAGLQETFEGFGFVEGKTVAYALATFGVIGGCTVGPLLATWFGKHRPIESGPVDRPGGSPEDEDRDAPVEMSPLTGQLTMHLAVVALIILTAFGIRAGLEWLEGLLRDDAERLYTSYIPLFSVVLLVGFGAQVLFQATGLDRLIRRPLVDGLSGLALDVVIVSALSTLALAVVADYWIATLALCLAGLGWNLAVFFVLGPRVYPQPWHAYGLGDFGGGTATTAAGLLLIRVADPKQRTEARQAYSEKQPFYEPFMGGGLVTAFAVPITAGLGAGAALGIAAAILGLWIVYAVVLARQG